MGDHGIQGLTGENIVGAMKFMENGFHSDGKAGRIASGKHLLKSGNRTFITVGLFVWGVVIISLAVIIYKIIE